MADLDANWARRTEEIAERVARRVFLELSGEREASVLGDPDVSAAGKSAAGQQLGKRSAAARRRKRDASEV